MISCPSCGGSLPDDASFCSHCGSDVDVTCPDCGESIPGEAKFCPSCGADLPSESAGETDDDEDGALSLRPREFARRVEGTRLDAGGLWNRLTSKKQVTIEAGNRALFLENGKLQDSLGPGKHTLDSLGKRLKNLKRKGNLTTVLVEDGETSVSFGVDDIRTRSDFLVSVTIELVVAIDDPEIFFKNMMEDRDSITTDTFQQILGGTIQNEVAATLKEYNRDELYGNRELKRNLKQDIERQCRSTLDRLGIRFVELRAFEYDDDRDHIREGQKDVEIRAEEEDIKDKEATLDRRGRERETDDKVHQENQRVRRQTAEQTADHEIETQEIEHDQEKDDMRRRHEHKAERENVEHEEDTKTTRKEGEVERREMEHEQDMSEMEDLMDLKKKKDMDSLDVEEREQDMEMRKEEHDVEMEKERLDARDDVDAQTLASMDDADGDMSDLAKMDKAENLSPEQLDALGAQESDELAKARQEAKKAEKERQRVEDQKEFREEIKDMAEDSMDRVQETTESAMDNMGETGKAAAEDTSDNVIVSDTGSKSDDSGDTTIVQGGGGSDGGSNADDEREQVILCPNCRDELEPDDAFCLNCGTEI